MILIRFLKYLFLRIESKTVCTRIWIFTRHMYITNMHMGRGPGSTACGHEYQTLRAIRNFRQSQRPPPVDAATATDSFSRNAECTFWCAAARRLSDWMFHVCLCRVYLDRQDGIGILDMGSGLLHSNLTKRWSWSNFFYLLLDQEQEGE